MDSIFAGAPDQEKETTTKRQQLVRQVLKLVFNADVGEKDDGPVDENELKQALSDVHTVAQEIQKDGERPAPTNDIGPILRDINAKLRELKSDRAGEFDQALKDLWKRLQDAKPAALERTLSELNARLKELRPADLSELERAVREVNATLRARNSDTGIRDRIDDVAKSGQAVIKAVTAEIQAHGERLTGAVQQSHEKMLASVAETNAKLKSAPEVVIPSFMVHIESRDGNGQIKTAKLVPV